MRVRTPFVCVCARNPGKDYLTIILNPRLLIYGMCADYQSDSDSFNPTLWEEQRQQRMTVAFDFEDKKEEEDNSGKVKVSYICFGVGGAGRGGRMR